MFLFILWFFTSIGHLLFGAGLLAAIGTAWMIFLSRL